jgi:phosphatidylglycerophosphate synthase
MKTKADISKFIHSRYQKIERNVHKSDFSIKRKPYSKLKAYLTIEIASIFLFYVLKTKITPNVVSLAGILWCALGSVFINLNNSAFIIIGLFILFTKIVPDMIDGNLATLKKLSNSLGHEFDLYAGNMNKVILIIGFSIYAINNNPYGALDIFYIGLIVLVFMSLADLRYHFIKFKNIKYHKNLKTHEIKLKNSLRKNKKGFFHNFLLKVLLLLHFNARSRYTDFLLLLVTLETFILDINILYFFPIIWSLTYFLAFLKSIHQTLKS